MRDITESPITFESVIPIVIPKKDIVKKPFCPECGTRMASNGNCWKCSGCGHTPVKNYRKKHVKVPYPCPYCDGKLSSKGRDTYCPECDKWIRLTKLKRMYESNS